jgi:hypothetical protein
MAKIIDLFNHKGGVRERLINAFGFAAVPA